MPFPEINEEALFAHGPFPHVHRSLNFFRPVGERVLPRAVVAMLVGWVPLVFLVAIENFQNHISLNSFLTDFGVHARSLLAAPLLILAEIPCLSRLGEIVRYFLSSGLIDEEDKPRFKQLVESSRSLMNSTLAEVLALLLAYATAALLLRYVNELHVRPWYVTGSSTGEPSLAGWWYVLVSVPLLLVLFFGWLWRVLLWGRFLIKVAKMKLCLIASHPDRTSGLKFLNSSLFAFSPVAFTIGVVGAGAAATRVQYLGLTLEGIEKTIGGLLIFVFVLFVGPLMLFVFKLHRTKMIGIFEYGGLAEGVGRMFEQKWLHNYNNYANGSLEATDFSATTDLYGIVSNVHEMRVLPFDLRGLLTLAVCTLLPFIPVVLMTIPLKKFLEEILKFLV